MQTKTEIINKQSKQSRRFCISNESRALRVRPCVRVCYAFAGKIPATTSRADPMKARRRPKNEGESGVSGEAAGRLSILVRILYMTND